MFLLRKRIGMGGSNYYFGEVDKYIKPFPAFELVGNSTAETGRNGRDPNLCRRGLVWGEHIFLACRAQVFCARSDRLACLEMRGAKTESACLLFQSGLLVR